MPKFILRPRTSMQLVEIDGSRLTIKDDSGAFLAQLVVTSNKISIITRAGLRIEPVTVSQIRLHFDAEEKKAI